MRTVSISSRRPNWLFRGLVGVSMAIHLVIFMHVSGIYRANALSYIELTMHDVSKPTARSIPRPRHRPKEPDRPQEIKRLKIVQRTIPHFRPITVDPAETNLPDSLVEGISMPDIPSTSGLNLASWTPGDLMKASADFDTPHSYLEMVSLRIERHKRYPEIAKMGNREGQVTVRFVITPDGDVREVRVVRTSRDQVLDTAALTAVQDAAPFPKPPPRFFQGDIPFRVTIFFELT